MAIKNNYKKKENLAKMCLQPSRHLSRSDDIIVGFSTEIERG